MSIIFKALKKAEEESRVERGSVKRPGMYQFQSKKTLRIIIAGIAVIALSFFGSVYLLKNRTIPKFFTKPAAPGQSAKKSEDVQPKQQPVSPHQPAVVSPQPPKVADVPDVAKLHEDAIKQIKEKNYSGAENILQKAILAKPNDAEMHNNLGLALKNQGKYKNAVAAYEKALKLKPDYFEAMNNLAVAYEMLGDKKKAQSFYKKALSSKPSYSEAHLNYALLLEAEGNNSEAESHYQTFLNLSSDEALKNKVSDRLKRIKK